MKRNYNRRKAISSTQAIVAMEVMIKVQSGPRLTFELQRATPTLTVINYLSYT
jgi:hypothetical protein